MAKRKLISKLIGRESVKKRWDRREERRGQTAKARQAYLAKKTVQQQQIDQEEGEAETEQQEIGQAEQVEETYDHAMDFDYHLENDVQMSPNLGIDNQLPPDWGAVADLLSADQIADFRATADQFRVHMLEHFRRHCSTSKFHHLVHHAPEFAENHGFWGLLNEQPVEKFHALFNDDLARKANTKDLHDILMFCARESAIRNAIFDSNEL
ncbi:hypothetical protein niasHT_030446 [Heterodera trifolii]|uniref:Uncharacterized protein n=1 Tax=Heterodera trifolii TaxID=157864 RepID=A0ABD2J3H0_9BILA